MGNTVEVFSQERTAERANGTKTHSHLNTERIRPIVLNYSRRAAVSRLEDEGEDFGSDGVVFFDGFGRSFLCKRKGRLGTVRSGVDETYHITRVN